MLINLKTHKLKNSKTQMLPIHDIYKKLQTAVEKTVGYREKQKLLTRSQVRTIVKYLGEP